jgi:predicted glycoside hydrolase/deacetylase ChbG (UPF0249 family)
MKKLIINADDFGYTPGVTLGIIEAHKKGVVTSTTALSVSPFFHEAMELASVLAPKLAIGLHLTLTLRGARPLLSTKVAPSLTNPETGEFWTLGELSKNPSLVDLDEVKKEFERQILEFLSSGFTPTHIDSHHGVHGATPEIWAISMELAAKYNLPVRNPGRNFLWSSVMNETHEKDARLDHYQEKMLALMPATLLNDFYGEKVTFETIEEIMALIDADDEKSGEVYEMNCHPGFIDTYLSKHSAYVKERNLELDLLTSEKVKQLIASYEEIQLADFRVLI